jgi:deoxycytidine triphosphate deaminase
MRLDHAWRTDGVRESRLVFSDRTIREETASGRLVLAPFDTAATQPVGVGVRPDRSFSRFYED